MGTSSSILCVSAEDPSDRQETIEESSFGCFTSGCHCGNNDEQEVEIKPLAIDARSHSSSAFSELPSKGPRVGNSLNAYSRAGSDENDRDASSLGDDDSEDTEIPEAEEASESRGHLYRSKASLQAVLDAGDAVLLRGSWLVSLAENRGVLPRRQELPEEAVCGAKSVLDTPVIVVSHCWQSPDHPDPEGDQLQHLSEALKLYLASAERGAEDVAVFLDWCSLHQVPRSPAEQAVFERGVSGIGLWFAHQETTVWMLTKVSWGARNYVDRGWPFFEKTVSHMITAVSNIIHINHLIGNCEDWQSAVQRCSARRRPPPLAPDVFARELRCKVFRAIADHDTVVKLYRQTFEDLFGSAKELCFDSLHWGDADAEALATTILDCQELRELDLSENEFGDAGVQQIADAIPSLSRLRKLKLGGNQISDPGVVRLAEMLPNCRSLQDLMLSGNTIGDSGISRLAEMLPRCNGLMELGLCRNEIGDRGAEQLAAALPQCTSLRQLDLSENEIGDRGATWVAAAIPRCPRLRKLDLARNRVGDQGAERLAEAIPFCRRLREFGVGGNEIGEILGGDRIRDAGAAALAPALRRCVALRKVDLSENQIGDRGAEKIAAVMPHLEGLAELDLCGNCIGDGGAKKLADAILSCTKLRKLRLPAKDIRDGAKKQLREAWLAGGREDSELSIF
eukprot:TRINITY_DN55755_c0_g1_i1.p1 TRINITY_DN55755_c0_g1~~TRINITY_DN55755_c0_g1_i1.p1  ORF type:complete len:680 (+),score=119.15 TRINITY_DN55755_c0_g1_i1:285-2324(+)